MILINYVSSEILYYYNWDIHSKSFSNIAVYKNLVESKSSNSNSSSEQEVIARFIITDASKNGIDNTPTILDQGAYTVFYNFDNDGLIYMANYWPKNESQSYGPMYSAENQSLNETYETYKSHGIEFIETPRQEKYGQVVVFKDRYGNKWDLIEQL